MGLQFELVHYSCYTNMQVVSAISRGYKYLFTTILMKRYRVFSLLTPCLVLSSLAVAQTPSTASSFPRLVRFSGTASDIKGNPLTGAAVVLLNDEASIMKGSELNPALAVAAPWLGNSKAPRTRALPPTSSVVAGVVLLIPILAPVPDPDWKIAEFVMSEILSHRGTKVAVPAPVTGPDANGVPPLVLSAAVAGRDTALCSGVARTNADGGSPPIVSASLAFSA